MSDALQIANGLFSLACFIRLVCMVSNQINRYFQNEDASQISFRKHYNYTYPTYTLCFEDNDEAGGIYRGYSFYKPENLTVYFDGRWLRIGAVDEIDKLNPNISSIDVNTLIGIPESMYIPVINNYYDNPFVTRLIHFNQTYLIPPAYYKNLLKGLTKKTLNVVLTSPQIAVDITFTTGAIGEIDFGNSTIHFEDLLEVYTSKTNTDTIYGWIDKEYEKLQTNCFGPSFLCKEQEALKAKFDAITKVSFPFVLSYQDPDRVCYTPRVKHSISHDHDDLTLDVQNMIDQIGNGNGVLSDLPFMRINIHMQGQLLRMFGKDVAHFSVRDLLSEHCAEKNGLYYENINKLCSGKKIAFLMSQVTLLRKRHDATTPCDQDLSNEDVKIMTAVIEEVGCVPTFWKSIDTDLWSLSHCKTAAEYRKIYRYASNVALSRSLITRPCNEMMVVTNILKEPGRRKEEKSVDLDTRKWTTYLDISFIMGSEMFQEITNVRDFGKESCWSGIGGFIGLFMGYSILQFPEILVSACQWLLRASKAIYSWIITCMATWKSNYD